MKIRINEAAMWVLIVLIIAIATVLIRIFGKI